MSTEAEEINREISANLRELLDRNIRGPVEGG